MRLMAVLMELPMAASFGFVKQFSPTALSTVAADDKEDINLASNEIIHGNADINRAARGV